MKASIPEGAVVRFAHGRIVEGDWGSWYRKPENWGRWDPESATEGHRTHESSEISPFGGRTTCTITLPDGTKVHGVAECSHRDNYSKKIGRDISLGRALKNLAAKNGHETP